MKELGADTSKQSPTMQPTKRAMRSPDPREMQLEMEQRHVNTYHDAAFPFPRSDVPGLNPNISRAQTSFFQDALKDVNLERPEELGVDRFQRSNSSKCFSNMYLPEKLRERHPPDRDVMKGKSRVILALIVLFYLILKDTVSQSELFIIMIVIILNLWIWPWVIDWTLDFIGSTSQVYFARTKFSRSLFLLLNMCAMVNLKFMLMLDSIFLVLYNWFRYYGRLIIYAVIAGFVIMIQWLSANAKCARSSEGQNHDRHASQHKKLATRNECRKWTDSAAARCSDGKNHDTTVSRSISSDLLDCMSNYKLPLLVVLLMIFYPDQCSIFTTNIIFDTVILSILLIGIDKISRLEKELSRLKSKQSEIEAKVEILEKNPTQNIFGPGSKQVNVVVKTEGSCEKITSSPHARSGSEALVGISDQQSLTDKPHFYNKNFGIDREEYEKIPVLPSIPL